MGSIIRKQARHLIQMSETETIENPNKAVGDRLIGIAPRQYDVGVKYRQPKLDHILKLEELYYNRTVKTLAGRFNIPLPIVPGFVDTLLSKIDDEITINYDHTEEADKMKARKISAAWKYDSAPTRGMWSIKDILVKKLAIFSGRGIYKIFSESDPTYKNHLEIIDLFDFIMEPSGGWHLENHLFCGQENIFRTKKQLKDGAASGLYDPEQVTRLIATCGTDEYKKTNEQYLNSMKRRQTAGLDTSDSNNYIGQELFCMVEWNMVDPVTGERYYLFFEPRAKVWIRCCPLKEIVGEPEKGEVPKYMFKSWATHPDAWNFLSKGPIDDIMPVAVALKIIANFMLDDFQKRLWGQRGYDPEMVTDPSQLEWDRPDKLIAMTVPNGKKISDGVYEFQTGDKSTVTINLIEYFRGFIGDETGVNKQAKGNSDEDVLGIAKINAGEIADRLGLYNKSYSQCDAELGEAYLYGLKDNMSEKLLIRMIGENGSESAEITKDDLKFSSMPDVRITGGKSEARKNQLIQEKKEASLASVATLMPDVLNKKVASESILENGGWTPDEIAALMDVTADGDEEQSIRASQAIQDALLKKPLELYRGATTRFLDKILDFSTNKKIDPAINIVLMNYAAAHKSIIIQNMAREAMLKNMTAPAPVDGTGAEVPAAPAASVAAPQPQPVTTP